MKSKLISAVNLVGLITIITLVILRIFWHLVPAYFVIISLVIYLLLILILRIKKK